MTSVCQTPFYREAVPSENVTVPRITLLFSHIIQDLHSLASSGEKAFWPIYANLLQAFTISFENREGAAHHVNGVRTSLQGNGEVVERLRKNLELLTAMLRSGDETYFTSSEGNPPPLKDLFPLLRRIAETIKFHADHFKELTPLLSSGEKVYQVGADADLVLTAGLNEAAQQLLKALDKGKESGVIRAFYKIHNFLLTASGMVLTGTDQLANEPPPLKTTHSIYSQPASDLIGNFHYLLCNTFLPALYHGMAAQNRIDRTRVNKQAEKALNGIKPNPPQLLAGIVAHWKEMLNRVIAGELSDREAFLLLQFGLPDQIVLPMGCATRAGF